MSAQENPELTSHNGHIKNTATCGAILTERNQRLTEGSTTKAVKKVSHRIEQEVQRNNQGRTCTHGGEQRKGGVYHKIGDDPW